MFGNKPTGDQAARGQEYAGEGAGKAYQGLAEAGNILSDKAQEARKGASETARKMGQGLQEGYEHAKERMAGAGEGMKEGYDRGKETLYGSTEPMREGFEKGKGDYAAGTHESVAERMREKAGETFEGAKGSMHKTGEKLSDSMHHAADTMKGYFDKAKEVVGFGHPTTTTTGTHIPKTREE
ncbi:hypothetical protein HDU76_000209 [Blyttiomyces sp. JEL0837]|nr:hypothetical protein HDU76_000209 [Blyttiomyces sp. JEL0837]